MRNKKHLHWVLVLLLFLLMSACQTGLPTDVAATLNSLRETQIAQTLDAVLSQTIQAFEPTATLSATPTLEPSPTQTFSPTPTHTSTSTPTKTLTPTNTPIPTNTPEPTSTPVQIPCNRARFIRDVTIEDGSILTPRASFIKVWQVQNDGSCTWTRDYSLVFSHGDRMSGARTVPLPKNVHPGESIGVSVELVAPRTEGNYRGYWQFQDNRGNSFGIGRNADGFIWVDIQVVVIEHDDTYNFAANFCFADWYSSTSDLVCPGDENDRDGFVILLENPVLENRRENQPTLWVHPSEVRNGYIEGRYPRVRIEAGQRFRAWVGCLEGYRNCDLTFYLDVITSSGSYETLGVWDEVYDEMVTEIDLGLSRFEGDVLQFILGVRVNNRPYDQAQGFWFVPRLEQFDIVVPPPAER